jgi:hypothetical protein
MASLRLLVLAGFKQRGLRVRIATRRRRGVQPQLLNRDTAAKGGRSRTHFACATRLTRPLNLLSFCMRRAPVVRRSGGCWGSSCHHDALPTISHGVGYM